MHPDHNTSSVYAYYTKRQREVTNAFVVANNGGHIRSWSQPSGHAKAMYTAHDHMRNWNYYLERERKNENCPTKKN